MPPTARQQAILRAALQVLDAEGVPQFTLKKVSMVLGVTDAALYKHFPDKSALFAALAEVFRETTLGHLQELLARTDLNALEKLEAFVKSRARQFQDNRSLTVALFSDELFRGDAQASSLNTGMLTEHARLLTQLAAEGQRTGLIRGDLPAAHVMLLLTGPMRLMVTGWKAQPDDGPPLVDRVDAWWNTVRLLLQPPSPPPR